MERRALTGLAILIAAAIVAGGAGAWMALRRAPQTVARARVRADARAPDGVRVRVQVVNGTRIRGLAHRATEVLRDQGWDVVETGTTSGQIDTTLVLDLSGHPDWAKRVAALFPPARIQARSDSSRYLDLAVVVGSAWRPPAEALYP